MRASERQRASGQQRPAWPGNAINITGESVRRCERASASERAASNGLRGRGTQSTSRGRTLAVRLGRGLARGRAPGRPWVALGLRRRFGVERRQRAPVDGERWRDRPLVLAGRRVAGPTTLPLAERELDAPLALG